MRNVTVAVAAILLVVFGIGVYIVRNQTPTPTVLASPTATPTGTATATPAPTPTQGATPSTSPVGLYVNPTFKFSLVLPEPYRKSVRLSIASTGQQRPAASDAFTARTDADEAITAQKPGETAAAIWNYTAVVDVFTGTGAQSPREFYDAFSFSRDQKIEDITVDGHPAVKVTNAPSYPIEYLIKDGDRMFILGYTIYQPGTYDIPPGATKEKLDAILASFKFVP